MLVSVTELPSVRLPAIDPCSRMSVPQKNGISFSRRAAGVSAQKRRYAGWSSIRCFSRSVDLKTSTSRPPKISSVRAPSSVIRMTD